MICTTGRCRNTTLLRAGGSYVGRGRSAVVYRRTSSENRDIALKIFTGDRASKLVNCLVYGAPNAYTWSEAAIQCAFFRRHIVERLLSYWFGERVQLARAVAWGWNVEFKAFELQTEFALGKPAALMQPFSSGALDETRDLVENVLKPLQRRLIESGFDGLSWQAGYGNPVANSNFLLQRQSGETVWTWVDLESGVPALFPLNPLRLFAFYLPKAVRHRRPLFDDVDIPKLTRYLDQHRSALVAHLGLNESDRLSADIVKLDRYQREWKAIKRAHRGISYRQSQGALTDEQAEWYRGRPCVWYLSELRRLARGACARVPRYVRKLWRLLSSLHVLALVRKSIRLLVSQMDRREFARRLLERRVADWQARQQLTAHESDRLHEQLYSVDSSTYITDFAMHIAIKPFVKATQWGVVLPLATFGVIGPLPAGLLLVFGGMLGRTMYTGYRILESTSNRYTKPWVALILGLVPVVGNAAFPMQILHASSLGQRCELAQFIVYDTLTQFGQLVPIWGGRDTYTEHFFNRVGDWVIRPRS